MKTNDPAARPDPPHGAPAVDPNLGHHPPAPPAPDPAPPRAGGKGQDQPRARPRISEHGRGRNPK
ncbi:MAG TPA: hypothetical protein VN326_05160 [Casimicrobiaceae bacterium]|nr:hypothetical protein [Casimicrobiaceae bacterium]